MKLALHTALSILLDKIQPLHVNDTIPLMKAGGRICATSIYASKAIPPFHISLRDGRYLPKTKESLHKIHVKDLIPIKTGENVPEDCLFILEEEALSKEQFLMNECLELTSSDFIKHKGEDIKKGECLIKKGAKIGPFDITTLASQGIAELEVIKEARIAYLGIGDELIDVKDDASTHTTYNSNAYTMAARGEMMGARTATITQVKDNLEAILEKLHALKSYDAIITSGGMSPNDAMYQLLNNGVLTPAFQGVAMAPAGLTALSFLEKTPILHLPGLPMACLLGFEVMGSALIKKLYGFEEMSDSITAVTASDIKYHPRSQSIVPGFFDGKLFFPERIAAGMLNVLNRCNGFILSPKDHPLQAGDPVIFYPFISWK